MEKIIGLIGNQWNKGKHHSEETLAKMRKSASKRIKHPSLSAYNKRGCRCEECKKIKYQSDQNYKKRA